MATLDHPSRELVTAPPHVPAEKPGVVRAIGLGLVTGAADDDPSAIGTYASAGAKLGPAFLWVAPVMLPMMITAVYLSSKLGLVSGEALFTLIRKHYSRPFLFTVLAGVLIGNVIEAGADIGGMASALNLVIPFPIAWIALFIGALIVALQIWGSYQLIRNVFRVLSLALLTYIGAAFFAHPDLRAVLRGTFLPTIHFNKDFLTMVVAVSGTSLSAYLFSWQSNQEVEEKVAAGLTRPDQRKGATGGELKRSTWDTILGMFFSNLVMYFVILSTGATLFKAGHTDIQSAAQAAEALRPIAGNAAGALFALGIVAVGFLAVPVMTTGAAYDLCQSMHWKYGLHRKPSDAKKFYAAIGFFTLVAVGFNCIGINPMKALVFAGVVQGFSTAPLLLLIMHMSNNGSIVGKQLNRPVMNFFALATTAVVAAAAIALLVTFFL